MCNPRKIKNIMLMTSDVKYIGQCLENNVISEVYQAYYNVFVPRLLGQNVRENVKVLKLKFIHWVTVAPLVIW